MCKSQNVTELIGEEINKENQKQKAGLENTEKHGVCIISWEINVKTTLSRTASGKDGPDKRYAGPCHSNWANMDILKKPYFHKHQRAVKAIRNRKKFSWNREQLEHELMIANLFFFSLSLSL